VTPRSGSRRTEESLIRAAASGTPGVPLELEPPGKPTGHRPCEQDVTALFHDEPCNGDWVDEPFEGGDCARSQSVTFHDRGIHPLDAVELMLCAAAGVEEARVFQNENGAFDREQGGAALTENRMAGGERVGKARGLARRHRAPPGAAVRKDQEPPRSQLRRRSLAFW
jgi:hypothetical protein